MTSDETEGFLRGMRAKVESGELPDTGTLSMEQKNVLLRACRLVDSEQKLKAASFFLAQIHTEEDERAFKWNMKLMRHYLTLYDFAILLWSVPGAIFAMLIYLIFGGERELIINLLERFIL